LCPSRPYICYNSTKEEVVKEKKMRTAKEEVRRMLEQIPDDATFEDIQYHIYVREKIERGLKDVKEGRLLSQEEVEQRMSKWLGK
jgi:predicted transcriptional regulator